MYNSRVHPPVGAIWEETSTSSSTSKHPADASVNGNGVSENTLENIKVAEMLLKELKPVCRDIKRYKVLENYALMASRQKNHLQSAMTSFSDMLQGTYIVCGTT